MGLFSSIGKAVKGITGAVSSVTGGGGILGSGISGLDLFSTGVGLLNNAQDNQTSVSNARMSQEFTKEMMQNRHTWEVADLKKAGLNPILSAGGTPSMGNSPMAETFSQSDALNKSSNTALARQRLSADLQAIKANINNTISQTALNKAATISQQADALLKTNNARVAKLNGDIAATEVPAAAATNANTVREQGNFISKYIRPYTKSGADTIGDFTGAIGNIFRGSSSTSTNHSIHYKGD